uniref:Uncharacterized protein n=1 Tax=Odontella aurita TaxID=265563 RepID=A0A7S4MX05_9STRA|mmetsp:Transcript_37675/g.112840  ORF Transcript_37675/g.112840 Transcript_37675/m.112840 type:complete len:138 (+) Transcript_37675:150-563(+)
MKRSRSRQRIIFTRSIEPSLQTIVEADEVLDHETDNDTSNSRCHVPLCTNSPSKRCKHDLDLFTRKCCGPAERKCPAEDENLRSRLNHSEDTIEIIRDIEKLLEMHHTITVMLSELESKSEELQRDREFGTRNTYTS